MNDKIEERRRHLEMFGLEDERVDYLIDHLRDHHHGGFTNNIIWRDELLVVLQELKSARERPLHCPCCDGDHQ